MLIPYSRYARLGKEYRVELLLGRCREYINVGKKGRKSRCNLVVTNKDYKSPRLRISSMFLY
jgi:hypothetical protein